MMSSVPVMPLRALWYMGLAIAPLASCICTACARGGGRAGVKGSGRVGRSWQRQQQGIGPRGCCIHLRVQGTQGRRNTSRHLSRGFCFRVSAAAAQHPPAAPSTVRLADGCPRRHRVRIARATLTAPSCQPAAFITGSTKLAHVLTCLVAAVEHPSDAPAAFAAAARPACTTPLPNPPAQKKKNPAGRGCRARTGAPPPPQERFAQGRNPGRRGRAQGRRAPGAPSLRASAAHARGPPPPKQGERRRPPGRGKRRPHRQHCGQGSTAHEAAPRRRRCPARPGRRRPRTGDWPWGSRRQTPAGGQGQQGREGERQRRLHRWSKAWPKRVSRRGKQRACRNHRHQQLRGQDPPHNQGADPHDRATLPAPAARGLRRTCRDRALIMVEGWLAPAAAASYVSSGADSCGGEKGDGCAGVCKGARVCEGAA